jgi:hypothetical protein
MLPTVKSLRVKMALAIEEKERRLVLGSTRIKDANQRAKDLASTIMDLKEQARESQQRLEQLESAEKAAAEAAAAASASDEASAASADGPRLDEPADPVTVGTVGGGADAIRAAAAHLDTADVHPVAAEHEPGAGTENPAQDEGASESVNVSRGEDVVGEKEPIVEQEEVDGDGDGDGEEEARDSDGALLEPNGAASTDAPSADEAAEKDEGTEERAGEDDDEGAREGEGEGEEDVDEHSEHNIDQEVADEEEEGESDSVHREASEQSLWHRVSASLHWSRWFPDPRALWIASPGTLDATQHTTPLSKS